jgi:GR25 family glycosyltransferase involved in LPS biosynthesis
MKINLLDIPVYYISLEDQYETHTRMKNMLTELGFKNIIKFEAQRHPNGKVAGCADSHAQIFEMNPETPFIILEDDCFLNTDFVAEINVPDDADALYLGVSYWSRYCNISGHYLHAKQKDDNMYQVYNMLATHAILYINKEYISNCKRIARWSANKNQHLDIGFAENHKFYNVYSFDKPLFYQESSREVTNKNISSFNGNNNAAYQRINDFLNQMGGFSPLPLM